MREDASRASALGAVNPIEPSKSLSLMVVSAGAIWRMISIYTVFFTCLHLRSFLFFKYAVGHQLYIALAQVDSTP